MEGCDLLTRHQSMSIFFCLWAGITGIVALTLNDMSECAESYQTLRAIGIGLTVYSIFFFFDCFSWKSVSFIWQLLRDGFPLLVYSSAIFVFVSYCVLIDEMVRGNPDGDCSGGRGTVRLFIVVWAAPFVLAQLVFGESTQQREDHPADFYGRCRACELAEN